MQSSEAMSRKELMIDQWVGAVVGNPTKEEKQDAQEVERWVTSTLGAMGAVQREWKKKAGGQLTRLGRVWTSRKWLARVQSWRRPRRQKTQ